ncbi:CDP-alcohol phosphatidyltransferase family protein [bacterium]|nr:CDP-alcohol phosphatidyltransferase family protein [bacterium]
MNKKLHRLWATKTKEDEWWSSFVTSPLAIIVNYFVVDYIWLTPNLITIFSFLVAIIATGFIIIGGTTNFIIAAVLIHMSHVLDCMDGQMARYRGTSSRSGSYFDKLTDQIQVIIWFGAVGYAAYLQTQDILPVFLALAGVSFYSLRGYTKYVTIYTEMSNDKEYLIKKHQESLDKAKDKKESSGLCYGISANVLWFIKEQRKIFSFDEGVFIFMLSAALIFNIFVPMLWVFAISQIFYGLLRGWQRGYNLDHGRSTTIKK